MKKIRKRSKEIVYYFLLGPTRFLANLIKNYVFSFSGAFGTRREIVSDWGNAEKLAGSGGEKSRQYLQRNDFYGQSKKTR